MKEVNEQWRVAWRDAWWNAQHALWDARRALWDDAWAAYDAWDDAAKHRKRLRKRNT